MDCSLEGHMIEVYQLFIKKGDQLMKITRTSQSIVIAAVVLIAGATFAFAHGGWGGDDYGYGRHMRGNMMGPGCQGRMMGPGQGRGHHHGYANLSDEERAKVDAAREKFFDETRSLRRDIDDQTYALRKEMNSDNPDSGKVAQLQKQLSSLQAEFDQKAVQHRLEMRKLLPEKFRGGGWGYGCGYRCWQN
jgi:Spy/CpxP family protein refolding chaperone